jgi:hypothetical protein
MGTCGLIWEPAGRAEESAPSAAADQGTIKDQPGKDQPDKRSVQPSRRTAGPNRGVSPSAVWDERGAGPSGDPQGFSRRGGKADGRHPPSEKTTVLSLSVTDLLPHTGNARISYILGYRSKKLAQINIVWTSDGTDAGDETVVGIANSLRDYFATSISSPTASSSIISSPPAGSWCFAAVMLRTERCC